MKSKNKFIILSILIVLLVAALSALTYLSLKNTKEAVEEPKPVQIIDVKTAINSFSVTKSDETYSVMYVDGIWFSPENPNAYLDNEYTTALVEEVRRLYAIPVEENAKDFSVYGLDNPESLFEFVDESGDKYTLKFGNKVPTGSGHYFTLNDNKNVYRVSNEYYTLMCGGFDSLRNKKLFAIESKDLYSISITNADSSFTIRPKTIFNKNAHSSAEWEMSSPYLKDVNQYIYETNILNALDFSIYEFVDDNPTDYSKYGLDNPKYTITVTTNLEITFLLGDSYFSTDGTNTKLVYMMVKGIPNVFAIKEEQVAYKDMKPVDLLDSLVFSRILTCVDTITYSDANETHTLKAVEPTFYVDGKKVNETAFRDAYTKIISPTILGEVSGNVGTQLCSLTFNYNTDTSSETIVFYEYGDLYAAVAIDGRTQFYVNRSSVKDMMNAINKLSE